MGSSRGSAERISVHITCNHADIIEPFDAYLTSFPPTTMSPTPSGSRDVSLRTSLETSTAPQQAAQTDSEKAKVEVDEVQRGGKRDFGFLPIPKKLRYDSSRKFEFTTVLNVTFGFASTFSE